jgi:class 3 adenylate cyclase
VEDLKDLGVGIVGHRRKLLDAIAALRANSNAKAPSLAPASPLSTNVASTFAPVPEPAGERRYLTVMFCDLVGSTSIAAKLDAEEWRDLVGAYLDAATAAVTEMGGHVAKKLGDGVMALFGYPVAQENDAERAARAALAIQRALAEINRRNAGKDKPALSARIGLEAGPVVVDATGEIFDDAPNVAARVQAFAEPGAVLITARVQRQVAGLFVAEDRGVHTLQGRTRAHHVVLPRAGERRRTPCRAAPSDTACGSRRGNGDAHAALGAGAAGRRAVSADHWRAGIG